MTDDTLRFDVPHSARVWNYWLGGKDNYPADRAVGDRVLARHPAIREIARQARRFLVRSVTHVAGEGGVDQFLDIGTGLPTMENTHEVAQRVRPNTRVVYVDNDPLVLVHARTLLKSTNPLGLTDFVAADARDPKVVLAAAAEILDLDRPVAVMFLGILGHATPALDQMQAVIGEYLDAMAPGSYLLLQDGTDTVETSRGAASANGYTLRSVGELASCFDGLDLLEPGVVSLPFWRPEPGDTPEFVDSHCGVARKP